jgi:hypothetical protein
MTSLTHAALMFVPEIYRGGYLHTDAVEVSMSTPAGESYLQQRIIIMKPDESLQKENENAVRAARRAWECATPGTLATVFQQSRQSDSVQWGDESDETSQYSYWLCVAPEFWKEISYKEYRVIRSAWEATQAEETVLAIEVAAMPDTGTGTSEGTGEVIRWFVRSEGTAKDGEQHHWKKREILTFT